MKMQLLTHTLRSLSTRGSILLPLLPLGLGAAALLPAQESAKEKPPPAMKKLGILVYPGVQVIDLAGPYEVLSSVSFERKRVFDVVTVGSSSDTIRTSPGSQGLRLTPDFTIDDC